MLVDVRTYHAKPGKLAQQLDLYHKHGFAPQTRFLGSPVAYMYAESGDLNRIVHLWAYESAADREQKRAAMARDPEWQNYLKLNAEAAYLVEQRNSLMIPAGFAPIKR